MQAILNLAWEKLLPAMQPSALASDDEAVRKLKLRLAGLTVRLPEGGSERAKVSETTYVFPANELKLEAVTVQHDRGNNQETLITRLDGVEQRIACGAGRWQGGQVAWGTLARQPAASAGSWANDTFTAKICFYETPFVQTIRLKFSGNEVTVNSESNVGFGRTKYPEVVGKAP
jgi:hypothetical protein